MTSSLRPGLGAGALRRGIRALVGFLAIALVASGCEFSVYALPLPGGAATGDDTYEVTVEFDDVLDLVPQSAVKVDDVSVGQVEDIWLASPQGSESGTLRGSTAKARIRLRGGVNLPDNAVARIRQTSLLGEKFVSLSPPKSGSADGRLGEGDTIPLSRTGRNTEVEEVLSALSLLLNGGGVAQLKTISHELNTALGGREESVRTVLRELRKFVGELDSNKAQINRTIERLNQLSRRLANQKETIATTLDDVPKSLRILADQRANLTKLLKSLSKLGTVGARVIKGTREDLLANLRALDPTLTELAKAGSDLPNSLQLLFTYPFADSAANAIKGDYTNLQLTLDLDLRHLDEPDGPLPSLPPTPTLPDPVPTDVPTLPTEAPTLPEPTEAPTLPEPSLPTLPSPNQPDPQDTGNSEPCVPPPPLNECPDGGAATGQATSAPGGSTTGASGTGGASGSGGAEPARYDPNIAKLLLPGVVG